MKANPKLGAYFDGEVDAAQKAGCPLDFLGLKSAPVYDLSEFQLKSLKGLWDLTGPRVFLNLVFEVEYGDGIWLDTAKRC